MLFTSSSSISSPLVFLFLAIGVPLCDANELTFDALLLVDALLQGVLVIVLHALEVHGDTEWGSSDADGGGGDVSLHVARLDEITLYILDTCRPYTHLTSVTSPSTSDDIETKLVDVL